MIKNEKGFVLTEILILSAVVIGVLTFMFIQFKTINRSYQKSFKYDTPEGLYLANNILKYINDDNFDLLVEQLSNSSKGYIDITDCDINIYHTSAFCSELYNKSGIEKIFFTKENPARMKINIKDFDNETQDFIKQIKTINSDTDYRIVIKYKNNTFVTMRFNKGNAYVQSGLITYLDAINNTGEGHLNDTANWRDLSGNGNNAILYNNPIWNDSSIIFDGVTNCGRIENTANKDFLNGFTLESRLRVLSNTGALENGIVEFINNFKNAGFGLSYDSSGKYSSTIYTNNDWKYASSTDTYNTGIYHTLTTTYDNNLLKLYIDGAWVKTTEINNNTPIATSLVPIGVGCTLNVSDIRYYSNAEFQNVLIYDRALSENEVQRNYQADIVRY